MALLNVFSSSGTTLWQTTTNWSLGVIPVQTDGYITMFTPTSNNCVLNGSRTCCHLNMSGYTGTISMGTSYLTVAGNINLGSAITFSITSGIGQLQHSPGVNLSAATLTSNGCIYPGSYMVNNASSNITLLDDFTCLGQFSPNYGAMYGHTIYCGGINPYQAGSSVTGTTTISCFGPWQQTTAGIVKLNTVLTSGASIQGNVYFGDPIINPTLTIQTGFTFVTTGSTINIDAGILDTNNMQLNNLYMNNVNARTITLKSGLQVAGALNNVNTANHYTISATTNQNINLLQGAIQDLDKVNFTNISATGLRLYTFRSVLVNTNNIMVSTAPKAVSKIF